MKQHVLKLMKEQMYHAVERLSYENLQEIVNDISNCFAIIQATSELPDLKSFSAPINVTTTEQVAKEITSTTTVKLPDTYMTLISNKVEEEDRKGPFRFERKFKGGFVPEANAFVPEKTVRDLDLHHGDLVYATFLNESEDGPSHFEIELAERKNEKPVEDRVEINFAIVEYDGSINRYIAEKTQDGKLIRYNDAPYTVMISEDDVRDLKLRQDDIVDIVTSKSNPSYNRVVWRWSTDEIEDKPAPRPSSYYKKKDDKDNYTEGSIKETLKGKTVCMMGYEPGKSDMQTEVEKRGGKFLWLSGRETSPTLSATMNKSDAVILMLGHVGHAGTIFAVDHCKRQGIACGSIQTFGRSSFIAKAEELIEESK